ncbi:X-ray repair cross-complementing protein 5 [Hetaerina americana]|uniref:X-ray repair cross-complementing protein 5 n=1 Tax=Hetaerina americana TaxID=62018 RepID=UPI003A7F4762
MSQKAAVVLILDVGYSEFLPAEEGEKFLQTSRECASMTVQSKIFTSTKDELCLILMGCNDCRKHDGESHGSIKIVDPLGPPSWDMVRKLKSPCTGYHKANWIKAVNLALNVLRNTPGKFSEKRIAIFTSNLKIGSLNKVVDLECGIHDQVVDLILIHPNESDDPEMAELNGEINEAKLIVEKVEGTACSIDLAALQLLSFQKKKVKPRPWNVCLDIGSKILIPVSGYKKMNEGQKLKWENCLSSEFQSIIFPEKVVPSSHGKMLTESPGNYSRVSRMNVDVRSDGREVERTEIIEGYRFGSSLVPFREEDKVQSKYLSGEKCLSVVKVTRKIFVPRHYWIDKSSTCIVARDDDEDAAVAFSALVKALDHLESVAIVRMMYYSRTKPHMGALFPVIKPNKEYLVFVKLPFASSMRKCLLPELKVNHLTAAQFAAIDQLIDGMDLSTPVDDDKDSLLDKEWSALFQPHKVFDPYLQYIRRCVASRILNPGDPLPKIDPEVYKMLTEPPEPIKESVSETLDCISQLFSNLGPERDQPKKGGGKRSAASMGTEDSHPVVEDGGQPTKQIREDKDGYGVEIKKEECEIVGSSSPIEDFKAALELEDIPFDKVCKQMQEVIIGMVESSFGLVDFEKPRDCLKVMRNAVITHKMDRLVSVTFFNSWMKDLHQLLREKFKMGFWNLIKQGNLGFITNEECSESSLTNAEINEIYGCNDSPAPELSEDEEMDLTIDM